MAGVMDIVLCWHMHQPDYRLGGRYRKPWTWLHAVKDYTDMAAHLESVPGARAVINFSPVLIEQLQDYPRRIRGLLERGEPVGDFVLDALGRKQIESTQALTTQLLRVTEATMKDRFGPYARLFEGARAAPEEMSRQALADLLVWYVLVWLGESLRGLPAVEDLSGKESGFTFDDRRRFLVLLADVIDDILPRYCRLADNGTIELSVTPYAHPILPLLLDFESAQDAMPKAALPPDAYPGGDDRCRWQLTKARRVFEDAFGMKPVGCWPSEGGLSQATLRMLAQHDFRWTASGSQVLANTLRAAGESTSGCPHLEAWAPAADGHPACFFRDDGLSDLIGFEYAKWPATKAVEDFVAHLEKRRDEYLDAGGANPVLSIIMDGENAWEYYPENGWAFLRALYTRLADHPSLRLTTFSDVLDRARPRRLPEVCAGSWVHGTFSTWIGEPAKNRAWDLLGKAKRAVDAALERHGGSERPEWARDVLRQLAICEASDWFWWLGEGNELEDAPEFDAMFRRQLAELYRLLGMAPPDVLDEAINGGEQATETEPKEIVGAMRRSG